MEQQIFNDASVTSVSQFNHDKARGKWESPNDFLFACVGNGFKIDVMLVLPLLIFIECGCIYTPIYYIITLAICAVPMIMLYSFLGQFSSKGFLSAFRVVRSARYVAYFSLIINLLALVIYGVFSTFPLLYIFNDLVGLDIPFSSDNLTKTETKTYAPGVYDNFNPSDGNENNKIDYSGPMVVCLIVIWIIVILIVHQPTELLGRFIRYSVIVFLFLMSICLLRFLFLPGAVSMLMESKSPELGQLRTFRIIPLLAYSTLGPGWGSVVTIASFNNFRTNFFKLSWLVGLMQFGIICGMTFLAMLLKTAVEREHNWLELRDHPDWTNLLEYPSTLNDFGVSKIWSVFLCTMLALGCLNLLVVQFYSFLTSFFDEFGKKDYASYVFVTIIVVMSTFFCSKAGIVACENLSRTILLLQILMDLLLMFVIFKVYGLVNFQRDLQFMIPQTKALGFGLIGFTPFFLGLQFILGLMWGEDTDRWDGLRLLFVIIYLGLITLLLFCVIPICCVFINNVCYEGTTVIRVKQIKPNTWYPAHPDDKQSYEELLIQNQSQPLNSGIEVNV